MPFRPVEQRFRVFDMCRTKFANMLTPSGGIPNLPIGLGLNFATPGFGLPTAVIDRIALDLHINSNAGPVQVPIFGFGGSPGFSNATTSPSSGFYNVVGGGGSGFWNSGTGMSGLLNVFSNAALGSSSGFYNSGTHCRGSSTAAPASRACSTRARSATSPLRWCRAS